MSVTPTERRIRWAGFLVALGLLVQLVTFLWVHALAFSVFLAVGCPLVAAGIVVFLLSLLTYHPPSDENKSS